MNESKEIINSKILQSPDVAAQKLWLGRVIDPAWIASLYFHSEILAWRTIKDHIKKTHQTPENISSMPPFSGKMTRRQFKLKNTKKTNTMG
jgi:hypothetical protein